VRQKELKKQKFMRTAISVGIAVVLFVLSLGIFMFTFGLEYLKEHHIGYTTEELLEKEWITSEYGEPAIVIQTPKVLKRNNDEKIQNNLPENVKSTNRFMYGSIVDDFSIVLITTAFKDTTKLDIEVALENDLKELVKSKNLENRIHFIGALSNPYPIVANSQFYICSSRYEGLPTAMIEAMSLGKSVISTPCDFGPIEILENGKYGVLSSNIDSLSLADSIIKYLDSDKDFIDEMNHTSVSRSQFFSAKSSIDNLLNILS
jgi:glycosyltransferase involved in cell wall biosynthesis